MDLTGIQFKLFNVEVLKTIEKFVQVSHLCLSQLLCVIPLKTLSDRLRWQNPLRNIVYQTFFVSEVNYVFQINVVLKQYLKDCMRLSVSPFVKRNYLKYPSDLGL